MSIVKRKLIINVLHNISRLSIIQHFVFLSSWPFFILCFYVSLLLSGMNSQYEKLILAICYQECVLFCLEKSEGWCWLRGLYDMVLGVFYLYNSLFSLSHVYLLLLNNLKITPHPPLYIKKGKLRLRKIQSMSNNNLLLPTKQ